MNDHRVDILGSIVVSIPACHAGDRGSIPRRGAFFNPRLRREIEINCAQYAKMGSLRLKLLV